MYHAAENFRNSIDWLKVANATACNFLPEKLEKRNAKPMCVCCGVGVDSVAMLVGLYRRGIRPDLISFADTGGEKPETYEYVNTLNQWLADVDFPPLLIVRNVAPRSDYDNLYDNCIQNETLPSIAFGMKSCSLKWKKAPQDDW